jgi:hypothetical protein
MGGRERADLPEWPRRGAQAVSVGLILVILFAVAVPGGFDRRAAAMNPLALE